MPMGIVIKDGKLVFGSTSTVSSVIAFDNNNHLIVGQMSGGEALEKGVRDAVSFGPADFKKCPFIPKDHGEIHCPDETRSVETTLNAVKVYIRAFAELDTYYSTK